MFPPSKAVQVTVVTPRLKVVPLSDVPVPVVAPERAKEREAREQLSVAVASHAVPEWT